MSENIKKIRITEGKLLMIELLEQSSGAVDVFSAKAKRMEAVVDNLWNKVTFMGVGDIIGQTDALQWYIEDMERLDAATYKLSDEKEGILQHGEFDDAMQEFDVYVDGLLTNVRGKTTLLTDVITHLLEVGKRMRASRGRFPEPTEV